MKKQNHKGITLDQFKDKYIGNPGSPDRDQYEFDLKMEILGEMIKKTRKERNMTQEELGQLIGVNKSEISKLEKNSRNMTIGTVIKIFHALRTNVKLKIELENQELSLT
jgi:HTH-type transcriptional regulator / antitoxin HipB